MVAFQRSRFPRRKRRGTVWIGSEDQGGDLPIFVDLLELVGRVRAFDLYSRGVSKGFSPRSCGTCEEQGLGGTCGLNSRCCAVSHWEWSPPLLVGKSLVNLARITLFLSFGPFQPSVDVGSGLLPGRPLKMACQEDVPSTRAGLCRPRRELEKEQVVIHSALPSSRAFPSSILKEIFKKEDFQACLGL